MKILISPAKTLDYETELPLAEHSQPQFLKQSRVINKELKLKSPAELETLMDISPKLSELNWQRNKARKLSSSNQGNHYRPSIFAFNGDVYTGLDAYSLNPDQILNSQQHLRILSGLYGLLRPLDMIEPYRLEMGTSLPVGEYKNLYEFWKPTITKSLNKELKKGELVVNLASQEYFSAIDAKALKGTLITPEFRDYKNGKLTMISFFAKKARGMMVRYILENLATTTDDLKMFNYDGYAFSASLSTDSKLVFTR